MTMKKCIVPFLLLALVAVGILLATPTRAATVYSPGGLLSAGDVTSTIIKNYDILDVDISNSAAIRLTKLSWGTGTGLIPYITGGALATSTAFRWDATGSGLIVPGVVTTAASSTLNNVPYSFPSSQG